MGINRLERYKVSRDLQAPRAEWIRHQYTNCGIKESSASICAQMLAGDSAVARDKAAVMACYDVLQRRIEALIGHCLRQDEGEGIEWFKDALVVSRVEAAFLHCLFDKDLQNPISLNSMVTLSPDGSEFVTYRPVRKVYDVLPPAQRFQSIELFLKKLWPCGIPLKEIQSLRVKAMEGRVSRNGDQMVFRHVHSGLSSAGKPPNLLVRPPSSELYRPLSDPNAIIDLGRLGECLESTDWFKELALKRLEHSAPQRR
jgi:hypothetical protein